MSRSSVLTGSRRGQRHGQRPEQLDDRQRGGKQPHGRRRRGPHGRRRRQRHITSSTAAGTSIVESPTRASTRSARSPATCSQAPTSRTCSSWAAPIPAPAMRLPISCREAPTAMFSGGEAGNDRLIGHGGNDIIRGGLGVDIMTSGAGRDTFDFNRVTGVGIRSCRAGSDRRFRPRSRQDRPVGDRRERQSGRQPGVRLPRRQNFTAHAGELITRAYESRQCARRRKRRPACRHADQFVGHMNLAS